MNRGDNTKLHLPGGTVDRTNQLAFLSLGDGGYNTFVGLNAGNKFPSSNNTFVGTSSGASSESASTCVFVGAESGGNASRTGDTIAIGYKAGAGTKDSYSNVLVGTQAGQGLRRADFNTAVGHKSMALMASGRRSVAVGAMSALQATNTANSVYIGYSTGAKARGSENVFVGSNAASNVYTFDSTLVGFEAGTLLEGDAVTAVGARALRNTTYSKNSVIIGANCASEASNVIDSVITGHDASRHASHVTSSVVIGALAGNSMSNCANNVVVGYSTARTLDNSSFNTLIGSDSASNASSQFSTVVGSKSMNRRNGERVEFSNCVIVGENISFDLPVTQITLGLENARRVVSNGSTFYDSTHLFQDPFTPLVSSDGAGTGLLMYSLDEAPAGVQPLTVSEREAAMFSSLEITPGLYRVSWYATAQNFVVQSSKYDLDIDITSNMTHHTLALRANVESNVATTRTITLANTAPSITWMDLGIQHRPEPEGIFVSYSFVSAGSTLAYTETAGTFAGGFLIGQYASSHPTESYVQFLATSTTANARKSVYATVTHAARSDSGLLTAETLLSAAHAVRGAGAAVSVDATDQLNLVDMLTHPGFTAADYTIPTGLRSARIQCSFRVPQSGTFGTEWLANTKSNSTTIGDGYLTQVHANGNVLSVSTFGEEELLFSVTAANLYSAARSSVRTDTALPIDIGPLKTYAEVWALLDVSHDLQDTSNGISTSLRVSGYNAGDYVAGRPAQSTREYVFTTTYPEGSIDSSSRDTISVFGSSATDNIVARDLSIRSSVVKTAPLFERCVFIGSNFTVQNDEKDTLVISLGPQNVIHATPNVFTISSEDTRLQGHLTIGSSTQSNYLSFGGLYGDGYSEDIPTAYVGERVYAPGTEKSELLLAKGEDPTGFTGPDRIRLLSGEVMIDAFANVASNTYVYTRKDFESIAQANTTSVFVANGSGVFFPSLSVGATELGHLRGIRSNIQQQLDNSFVTVTANKILVSNASGRVSNSNVNATQLYYLEGVTSSIQSQLNNKQSTISLTASRAVVTDTSGQLAASSVTGTEIGYLSGVTSGIQTQLNGKQPSGSYAAASHTHVIGDITNLQSTLDGKAPSSHTHTISNITGLQTALDGKQAAGSYAPASHVHSSITSGSSTVEVNGASNFRCTVDNLISCGGPSSRWTNVYAVNGTINTSDANEKVWEPLQYGLNELCLVNPIVYRWKKNVESPSYDPETCFKYYGVLAQEVNEIFPELVYDEEYPDVPMQLNYSEFIPVLINAIKELEAELRVVKQRLALLEGSS